MKTPHIPQELLEWLEELFPDRLPNLEARLEDIYASIGEQRVIRKLRQARKLQENSVLET